MKNYLLIFALLLMFGLLIAGCGNRTPQSSNDEILDDVTQNLNVEKIKTHWILYCVGVLRKPNSDIIKTIIIDLLI